MLEATRRRDVPSDTEIVVTKFARGSDQVIGYYLVSMSSRSVFWVEEIDVSLVTDSVRAVVSESHLGKPMAVSAVEGIFLINIQHAQ